MNRRQAVQSLALGGAFAASANAFQDPPGVSASKVRARYFHLVADDFVVNIWRNGGAIPDSKRTLTDEIYGATVERVTLDLNVGDWLVFHVVNNRLRWGGCRFFGIAAMAAENESTIISRPSPEWCYTDKPGEVPGFIADRDRLKDQIVKLITPDRAWDQGVPRLNTLVGGQWQGQPIWGEASSTWIKLRVT